MVIHPLLTRAAPHLVARPQTVLEDSSAAAKAIVKRLAPRAEAAMLHVVAPPVVTRVAKVHNYHSSSFTHVPCSHTTPPTAALVDEHDRSRRCSL